VIESPNSINWSSALRRESVKYHAERGLKCDINAKLTLKGLPEEVSECLVIELFAEC
jgi:hypothetical protein